MDKYRVAQLLVAFVVLAGLTAYQILDVDEFTVSRSSLIQFGLITWLGGLITNELLHIVFDKKEKRP